MCKYIRKWLISPGGDTKKLERKVNGVLDYRHFVGNE